jgi:hypothetical protein
MGLLHPARRVAAWLCCAWWGCLHGGRRQPEIAGPFAEIWLSFGSRYEKTGWRWVAAAVPAPVIYH